jgi:hypothetical protein
MNNAGEAQWRPLRPKGLPRLVARSCVTCHDEHPNSPRRDYNVGDVMGGIITLPIDTP